MRKSFIIFLVVLLALSLFTGLVFTANLYYRRQVSKLEKVSSQYGHESKLKERLLTAVSAPLVLGSGSQEFSVSQEILKSWLASFSRQDGEKVLYLDEQQIDAFLIGISASINSPAINAKLGYENGQLIEISPSKDRQVLDVRKSTEVIIKTLNQGQNLARLIVNYQTSEVTLDKLEKMGIVKLLGQGQSDFDGSPDSRIHNIAVSSRLFNNIFLEPDQEFSFNKLLGDVDAATGYLPELVIKKDKIIPEYGGGICQVSTTLFRAAFASGLAITERHPHSLPVRYYNPQGFDATIYPGVSDLRFKNDTGGNVLIQTEIKGAKIYFDVFGPDNGQQIAITGPVQYENNPDGSIKAVIRRTVTAADGQEKKDIFYSSYKSPKLFEVIRNPLE